MQYDFRSSRPAPAFGPAKAWRALAAGLALVLLAAAAAAQTLPPVRPVQVGPHAWFVQGQSALGSPANANFISNAGFIVTGDSVVVIDALGSPALARELLRQIALVTPKPVRTVILTHYHADHVYGLQVFKEAGATILANRHGREYLNADTARLRLEASRHDLAPWIDEHTRLLPADRWLDGDTDLEIGGTRLQLRAVGPSHAPDDTVVYLPDEKVLYAGDLVFRNRVPFVGTADSRHWIAALDRLLAFDARVIVPGHGPQSTDPRQDLQLTRDYIAFLRQSMGEAARNLEPFEDAYRRADWSRFRALPLFDAANRINAYNTYLLMEHEDD